MDGGCLGSWKRGGAEPPQRGRPLGAARTSGWARGRLDSRAGWAVPSPRRPPPPSPAHGGELGGDASRYPRDHARAHHRRPAARRFPLGVATGAAAGGVQAPAARLDRDRPHAQRPRAGLPAALSAPWPPGPGGEREGRGLDGRLPLAGTAARGRDRLLRLPPRAHRLSRRSGAGPRLRRRGFAIHRFSEEQIDEQPETVAADLRDALGLAS